MLQCNRRQTEPVVVAPVSRLSVCVAKAHADDVGDSGCNSGRERAQQSRQDAEKCPPVAYQRHRRAPPIQK